MTAASEDVESNSKYLEYRPNGGDALVKSRRSTIYFFYAEEAFHAAIHTYLVKATWMNQRTFENDTNANQMCSHQYSTHSKITSGAELATTMNVGAELKALTIGLDSSKKTFTNYETTTSQTTTLTVDIPPRTNITFYQRKYEFKIEVNFILDARSKEWLVGTSGSDETCLVGECTVEIMSDDFLVKDTELDNTVVGMMEVKTVPSAGPDPNRFGGILSREEIPQRAKRALHKIKF